MHHEEIQEIKRVNRAREDDLERKIINFEREKQFTIKKIKLECQEKERKKRDKFQGKIERIKRQEIAEVKRDADSRVSQALLQSRSVFEPKTASLV
jgi:hypothetical protein